MKITYISFANDKDFPSWLDRESEKDYTPADHGEAPRGSNW
jgi:hypothetical protein